MNDTGRSIVCDVVAIKRYCSSAVSWVGYTRDGESDAYIIVS